MGNNKAVWEELGENEAYFGVLTEDKFRSGRIDADVKREFFDTGREHVDAIWTELADAAGGHFQPNSAIDYGCGVGRILIPLAERCGRVTGVDISSSMLNEARSNADAAGLKNVDFFDVGAFQAKKETTFDLVHSYIVLQHIPPSVGYKTIAKLAASLSDRGAGMLHVTYRATGTLLHRLRFRMYRDIPGLHAASRRVFGRGLPFMPVYEYDLDLVREVLIRKGCKVTSEKDTDHGFLGKMFFLRKDRSF